MLMLKGKVRASERNSEHTRTCGHMCRWRAWRRWTWLWWRDHNRLQGTSATDDYTVSTNTCSTNTKQHIIISIINIIK